MRIAGSSMREAGLDDGDLALVDRAMEAVRGRVVIAVLDAAIHGWPGQARP